MPKQRAVASRSNRTVEIPGDIVPLRNISGTKLLRHVEDVRHVGQERL